MTETKFTPGPWTVHKHCGFCDYFVSASGHFRADIIGPKDDAEANGHLIAAAPDMHDLLVRLRSTYRDGDPAAKEIDAALKKARGETP